MSPVRFFIWFAALLWMLAPISISAEPSKNPVSDKWVLVAQSDLIVRTKLTIPPVDLKGKRNGWIDLKAKVIGAPAKGNYSQQTVTLDYYMENYPEDPLFNDFVEKSDQEVILFLVHSSGNSYTFARATPESVSTFTVEDFATVEREVTQQQEIGQHFDQLPVGKATATDAKVHEIFDRLTKWQTQEAAWDLLLKFSREDAPAIVRCMNDQTSIPEFDSYIPTSDSKFEAKAHYGPKKIIEAASTILPYLTGASFRFVYNGGSEGELLANLYAWRCWCAYNF